MSSTTRTPCLGDRLLNGSFDLTGWVYGVPLFGPLHGQLKEFLFYRLLYEVRESSPLVSFLGKINSEPAVSLFRDLDIPARIHIFSLAWHTLRCLYT